MKAQKINSKAPKGATHYFGMDAFTESITYYKAENQTWLIHTKVGWMDSKLDFIGAGKHLKKLPAND